MSTTPTHPLSQDEQIIQLQKKLAWAEMLIQKLQEELRLERIKKYGPASEKLDSAQLELLELEPGVSHIEVAKESQRGPLPSQANQPRRHPGRQELLADLPRVEKVIPCTPEQCTCKACGQPTAVIGYDESEHLDAEPVRYFVVVTKREKRVCKHCEAGGVATAPAPARIIEKSLVSDGLIIQTVVAKYCDHLPLYRLEDVFARHGVELSRATMCGWMRQSAELVLPLYELMKRRVLASRVIHTDDTPVEVLDPHLPHTRTGRFCAEAAAVLCRHSRRWHRLSALRRRAAPDLGRGGLLQLQQGTDRDRSGAGGHAAGAVRQRRSHLRAASAHRWHVGQGGPGLWREGWHVSWRLPRLDPAGAAGRVRRLRAGPTRLPGP